MTQVVAEATAPEWITALLAVVVAAASGVWAMTKWLADRADAREQERQLTEQRLRQEDRAEQHRREDRAAELVVKLGEAADDGNRRWMAGALAMYPAETTKLLVNALGHSGSPETASAITMALVSIGPSALPEVVAAHRLARTVVAIQNGVDGDPSAAADLLGATEMLAGTRRVVAHFLLSMDDCSAVDLEGVDLTGVNFAGADLTGAGLRKAILDGVVFSRAKIAHANLRGARATDAVFTRARAGNADFTGLVGPIGGIRLSAKDATVHDANLDRSHLNAANFSGADIERTSLVDGVAPGAIFDRAQVRRCHWNRVDLREASARGATFDGVRLSDAVLTATDFTGATLAASRLTGISARGLIAKDATLTDCNFGGADLSQADLRAKTIARCNFSGADLTGADLRGARLESCELHRTILRDAKLEGTIFAGDTKLDGVGLVVPDGWEAATFEREETKAAFAAAAASS